MKFIVKVLYATGLLALASCASVTSKKPIGDKPAQLDPKTWNGIWAGKDGHTLVACVKPSRPGILQVGWLDVKDDKIKFTELKVPISSASGTLWASFREERSQPYTIAQIKVTGNHLTAWTFEPAPIIKAVKSGALKGIVATDNNGKETGSVTLDSLSDQQLADIKSGKYGKVFDLSKPALELTHLKD